MKRPLRPEEARLWAVVTATVRPKVGRFVSPPPPAIPQSSANAARESSKVRESLAPGSALRPGRDDRKLDTYTRSHPLPLTPEGIEPNRRHRIARGREEIAARLDLHGLDQGHAQLRLIDFLIRAQAEGARAVLVITGKGRAGEGVLRRRAPEWLADARLRDIVAGHSYAENRHGGEGAYYVALKRRRR